MTFSTSKDETANTIQRMNERAIYASEPSMDKHFTTPLPILLRRSVEVLAGAVIRKCRQTHIIVEVGSMRSFDNVLCAIE